MKRSIGGTLKSGRQTKAPWESEFFTNLKQPLKRSPQRAKKVLEALKYLRDVNPDASMAVWNFLRLANQGHDVTVVDVNGNPDEEMQDYINDELAPRMGKIYGGGTDQLVNVLNLTGYTQGAEALEVELDESLTEVVDFHAVDPARLEFVPDDDGVLHLAQKNEKGEHIFLNEEQVFYVPLDPDADDPFGRSPMLPAVEAVLFQAQVLEDLKAVAHHQGHARFDISVSSEAILDAIPEESYMNETEVKRFVDSFVDAAQESFSNIEPDDDFYHNDSIKVDTVGGTAGKSMDAKALIDIIDQQIISSLKQFPILLGRNSSVSETHAKIQMELEYMSIRSIQKMTKRLLEKAYTVALRARGSQSVVTVTFDDVSIKNRTEDAQAEATEIANEIAKVNQGWIDNDEASNAITGSDAVGEPKQQQYGALTQYQQALSKLKGGDDNQGEDEEGEESRSYKKFPSELLFKQWKG